MYRPIILTTPDVDQYYPFYSPATTYHPHYGTSLASYLQAITMIRISYNYGKNYKFLFLLDEIDKRHICHIKLMKKITIINRQKPKKITIIMY